MQEAKREGECVVCLLRGMSVGGKETVITVHFRPRQKDITVCLCADHIGKKTQICVTKGGEHYRVVAVYGREVGTFSSFSYDLRKRATVPHYVWLPNDKCHDVYWRETHWESIGRTPLPAVAPTCEVFAAAIEEALARKGAE